MKQYFTSNELIASIKRRAMIPANQVTFTDDDFLKFANEEISLGLLPSILRLREDYFLFTEEIPVEADKSVYDLPHRAIGNKLREIAYRDSNGNIYEMTRIGIGDLPEYNIPFTQNRIHAYIIKNNSIELVPGLSGGPTNAFLVMSYYLRPNELVAESRAGIIKEINRTTGEIYLVDLPDDFATTDSIGCTQTYDFVESRSPHRSIGIDFELQSISTTNKSITVAVSDIPDNLQKGDYVNFSGETIVPQIPADLHVVLAHRVAARCLEALGDMQGLQMANQKLAEMEDKTTNLIDNRVEDSPKKVTNRHSHLRWGLYKRRYRYKG